MNDEFLTRFRKMPRGEFADALHERITQQPQPRPTETMVKKPTFRNTVIVFALLFLIAACVRVVLGKRWNKVGEIWVDVRSTQKYPFTIQTTLYKGVPFDAETMTLADAETVLGFDFQFPSWAPEGFNPGNQVSVSRQSPGYLYAVWNGSDKEKPIYLSLATRWYRVPGKEEPLLGSVSTWPIPPGGFEEVRVHGQPAVLIRGDWIWPEREVEGETELDWDEQRGLSLYWTDGEVAYLLWTYHPAVTVEDLTRMAESAQ